MPTMMNVRVKKLQTIRYITLIFVYIINYYYFSAGNMHCHIANIASFGADGRDPLITNDEEDSEKEDDIIKSDDNLVLIGHVEKDTSILEIFGLYKID